MTANLPDSLLDLVAEAWQVPYLPQGRALLPTASTPLSVSEKVRRAALHPDLVRHWIRTAVGGRGHAHMGWSWLTLPLRSAVATQEMGGKLLPGDRVRPRGSTVDGCRSGLFLPLSTSTLRTPTSA